MYTKLSEETMSPVRRPQWELNERRTEQEREREKNRDLRDHLEGLCPTLANGWDGKGEGT